MTHEEFYDEYGVDMRTHFQEAIVRGYNLEDALEEALLWAEEGWEEDAKNIYSNISREDFKKRLRVKMVIPFNEDEQDLYLITH